MLCLQLKPTVIRKKKSILLGSYGSPDSDGAMQGQILQLAKVRYERGADVGVMCLAPSTASLDYKMPLVRHCLMISGGTTDVQYLG